MNITSTNPPYSLSRRTLLKAVVYLPIVMINRPPKPTEPPSVPLVNVLVKPATVNKELTTTAHREHCSLDPETLAKVGGMNRQILLQDANGAYALYTVADAYSELMPAPLCRMGSKGMARLGQGNADAAFDATIDTTVTRVGEFTEYLLEGWGDGLAILAPHGGEIEPGTAEQAQQLDGLLLKQGKAVGCWFCEGYKKSGEPAGTAFQRWHITATDLAEVSFPKLGKLFTRKFAHAVAFHGWDDAGIGIGGGASTELKQQLRDAIRRQQLDGIADDDIRVLTEASAFSGSHPNNIVNRITTAGNGIQLEQSAQARKPENRAKVVQALADLYAERL